jgi:hypothetical protein
MKRAISFISALVATALAWVTGTTSKGARVVDAEQNVSCLNASSAACRQVHDRHSLKPLDLPDDPHTRDEHDSPRIDKLPVSGRQLSDSAPWPRPARLDDMQGIAPTLLLLSLGEPGAPVNP